MNIFLLNMLEHLLRRRVICTSTVCGYLDSLRERDIPILSAKKKMGYLADPKYLRYKGFDTADIADPYFELMYLPFEQDAAKSGFKERLKPVQQSGFALYYTNQCPFTAKYVPLLEGVAKEKGVVFQLIHISTKEMAQDAPVPFTTLGLFYNGQFVTHEILSAKKFEKIIMEKSNI